MEILQKSIGFLCVGRRSIFRVSVFLTFVDPSTHLSPPLPRLNYKTHNHFVPRKLYLPHGRYTMMGITHVGLFTAGGIYGSVASPPSVLLVPPHRPFPNLPNNSWALQLRS